MKKQQKLQHPFRKSPRLSSCSTSASAAAASSSPSSSSLSRLSKESKSGVDDAWALTLHVAAEPPTSTGYPSQEEDNSVRRSGRVTSNKYKTPPPEGGGGRTRSRKHAALVRSELSEWPVILSAPELTSMGEENVGSGEAGGPKKRRRLSADRAIKAAATGGNGNSRRRLLSLTEPAGSKPGDRGCLSERRLRSRTVLMLVGDGGDFSINDRRLRSRAVRYAVAKSSKSHTCQHNSFAAYFLLSLSRSKKSRIPSLNPAEFPLNLTFFYPIIHFTFSIREPWDLPGCLRTLPFV